MCEEVCDQHGAWDRQKVLDLHQNTSLVEQPLCSREDISFEHRESEVHLQVETVMPAGTLMLLLMTANTLMLYSTPASRLEMVQAVVLPGILISNGTPDRETNRRGQFVYVITFCFFSRRLDVLPYLQCCLACRSPRNPWAPLSPPTPGRWWYRSRLGSSDSWRAPLKWQHVLNNGAISTRGIIRNLCTSKLKKGYQISDAHHEFIPFSSLG